MSLIELFYLIIMIRITDKGTSYLVNKHFNNNYKWHLLMEGVV